MSINAYSYHVGYIPLLEKFYNILGSGMRRYLDVAWVGFEYANMYVP